MNLQDNQYLEAIVLEAPIGICILDADTLTAEIANDKFLEIAGKPYEAILGHIYWDIFPETRAHYEGPLIGVVASGEPYYANDLNLRLIRKDLEEGVLVPFVYSPVKDESGKVKKVAVWVLENTQQIRERQRLAIAEAAVRKERDLLDQFLMQAPAGICVLSGPELIYEVVNPAYQALLPGRNILNRPMFEALPELKGSRLQEILLKVYETGISSRTDELLIPVARYEGDLIPDRFFSFTYQARRDAYDRIDGILVFVYEVTELVEARKKAEDRERHFRHLADLVPAKISNALPNGEVTFFNKQWLDYSGLSFEDMRDFGYHNMMHPDEVEPFQKGLAQAAEKGIPYESEMRFMNTEGQYRWHLNIASPVLDENGKIVMWVGSTTDIQRIKEEEQRKNDFIGMVSHELKTPLTSLSAYVQVLQSKPKTPEDSFEVKALTQAGKQIKKMTDIINGFLNVTRFESGEIKINKQIFDLESLLNETEQEIGAMTMSHTIIFDAKCAPQVSADRDKIGQVLNNLVSNAIKYSSVGSTIKVSCRVEDNNVIVLVSDNGIGIKETDIPQLFKRYFRVETESNISGFGIGLYLCAEIIKRHEGKVWVESELGKGSTFYFSLPLA